MTTTFTTGGRATATDVTLRLAGLIPFQVDLWSVFRSGKSNDGGMKTACKEQHLLGMGPDSQPVYGPSEVSQRYICKTDPGHVSTLAGLGRGRVVDGVMVLASEEEVIAAKTGGLTKQFCELAVHPADEVDTVCRPGKNQYLLRPARNDDGDVTLVSEESYATLRELVAATSDRLAFMGPLRLANTRSVYRLEVWDGQLMAVEVTLPADLRERDSIDGEASAKSVLSLTAMVESSIEPFDEALHGWDAEQAVADLVAGKAVEQVTLPPAAVEMSIDDLVAAALG